MANRVVHPNERHRTQEDGGGLREVASVLNSEFRKELIFLCMWSLGIYMKEGGSFKGQKNSHVALSGGKVGRTQGNSRFTLVICGGTARLSDFIPKAMGSFGVIQILESLEEICHFFPLVPSHHGVTITGRGAVAELLS